MKYIKRGDIYLADLDDRFGVEQIGIRPVLIIQNNKGNTYSPSVTVIPITSKTHKKLPTHVFLEKPIGLAKDSIALCEQVTTIDKNRLLTYIGKVDERFVNTKIRKALEIQLGIEWNSYLKRRKYS